MTSSRLASLDALRGLAVAAMLLVNDPGDWDHVYAPLEHAEWNGCTLADFIFPWFLFLVGVSITLGVLPRIEAGAGRGAVAAQVLRRAARIVGLGLALHLLAWWALELPALRPWGVLQRIGLCFAAAALLALRLRARGQWACIAALLLGYWALLVASGGTAPWDNLASRVDTALLGAHVYRFDATSGRGHDPEGLLSTLPAIATTLLGVRAGAWVRAGRLRRLCGAGVVALLLGLAWAQVFAFNKNLWTSSYALWTGGWAMLALAAAHWAIDRRGWPAPGRSLGVNAIAVYAGSALMVYALVGLGAWAPLYRRVFADPLTPIVGANAASLAFAIAFVASWWSVAVLMRRRGWRIAL